MPEAKAQAAGDQDPSMEEILQSIRRIIAEDDKEKPPVDAPTIVAPAEPAKSAAPEPVPESDFGSDVLELTEMIEEPPPAPVDVMANIENALSEDTLKQEIPAPPPPPPPALTPNERLISDQVAAASTAALKKLVEVQERPADNSFALRSGTMVEDLLTEALRPMLKQWLDTHLPAIVQRMVEKEIRRLSSIE